MTDERIMERAKDACEAFRAERDRVREGSMGRVLKLLALIAQEVWLGEYHRQRFFKEALDGLEELGFDVSGIDTEARPQSEGVEEAIGNAIDDASSLYGATIYQSYVTREMTAVHMVMSRADNLMRAIAEPMLDMGYAKERLHDAVTAYIKAVKSRDDSLGAEIRKRARTAGHAFMREWRRVSGGPVGDLMLCHGLVALRVSDGEYHRDDLFERMVGDLRDLGFDTSRADLGERTGSEDVIQAAKSARTDACDLYLMAVRSDWNEPGTRASAFPPISAAADVMGAILDTWMDMDTLETRLRDAVNGYLACRACERKATGGAAAPGGTRIEVDENGVTVYPAVRKWPWGEERIDDAKRVDEAVRRAEEGLERALREVRRLQRRVDG